MAENIKSKSRPHHEPAGKLIDAWSIAELLLRRWRWLVVSAVVLAALCAAGGFLAWKKTFTATAVLMRYEPMTSGDFFKPPIVSQDTFDSLMKAPELLDRIAKQVQPPISPEMLSRSVMIKSEPDSDIAKVSVKAFGAPWAVMVANLYASNGVAYTFDLQKRQAEAVYRAFIQQRLDQMNTNIGELEKEFRALPQGGALTAKLNQVGSTVTNLNEQMRASALSPMVTARLNDKLQAALDELATLTKKYTDEYPDVQKQRAMVSMYEKELAHATNIAGSAAIYAPSTLTNGPGQLINPEYEIIRSKLGALSTSRQLMSDREQEAKAFMANPPGYVRFFSPATMEDIKPGKRWLKIALASVFGGGFGAMSCIFCILFVEFMDGRLKTAEDVQRVTNLPVIATLEDIEKKGSSARELWAFRTWTMLQGKMSPSPNHGLVCGITSATAGEGRSTWINLLADAASLSGFRVLTISAQSPNGKSPAMEMPNGSASANANGEEKSSAEDLESIGTNGKESHFEMAPDGSINALTTNVLSCPAEVTEQLTGPKARPSVHIPLPGWVWNLERRKQWQDALAHWRSIENLVILVDLPPAHVPEAVLLGENLPNMVWLTESGKADAAETRTHLETLRHAKCNLIGAVLNRQRSKPLKMRFPRWLGCIALGFLLASSTANAQTNRQGNYNFTAAGAETQASTNSQAQATDVSAATNLSFSITSPAQRSEWQTHLTLGPGDVISVSLFEHPESTRPDVLIGPDGRFSYMEAQNILADGLTIDELRTNLDGELGKYRRAPHTIVTPMAFRSKKYVMLGRVVLRGVYTLDRPITVVEAVARAHGLEAGISGRNSLDLADFQRSFLMRHGKRIPIDFEKLFLSGDLSQNVPVEPDDYFYFPPASAKEVYVLGEVKVPGPVPFTENMSLIAALSQRGGFTDVAYKSHVMVLRGSVNHPKVFVVDTKTILDARGQDFKLEPKDIIYVSGRPFLREEELLDLALSAFLQSMTAEWSGLHVGPLLGRGVIPAP